jgi:hypothetical protein
MSRVRWALPLGLAVLVVGVTVPGVGASAGDELPDRTAAQLLTDLQGAEASALQGSVAIDADLGLPALPQSPAAGPHDSGITVTDLLDGRTTMKVWQSSDGARVAVTEDFGEIDVISDRTQVWIWSSADQSVVHALAPTPAQLDQAQEHEGSDLQPPGAPTWGQTDPNAAFAELTPAELSAQVLAAVDPSTEVTTGPEVRVANRPAYQLVLTPRDSDTLIASVTIAIDAAERVPTRVTVTSAATGKPALTAGFTEVSCTAPDPEIFTFTPPEGAEVTEHDWSANGSNQAPGERPQADASAAMPQVVGQGWSSVLVLPTAGLPTPGPTDPAGQDPAAGADLASWITTLPEVSGSWGTGRLLTSHLFSVLVLDDGRMLVGAVDGDALQHAAEAAPDATTPGGP